MPSEGNPGPKGATGEPGRGVRQDRPYGNAEGAYGSTTPPPPRCMVCGVVVEQRLRLVIADVLVAWVDLCHQHAQYFAAGGWSISLEKSN